MKSTNVSIGVIIHTTLLPTIFASQDIERLQGLGDVVFTDSQSPISIAEACKLLEKCDIGIGSWNTPYPGAELLAACPNLRLWEHAAGTVKHMFGPHLEGRDLVIASCKTAIAGDVAEITLGEMIVGLRQIPANADANRSGIAPKPSRIRVLSQSTVGIIGASEVGKRVAQRLVGTGCRTLIFDPFLTPAGARELGGDLEQDLTEMCAKCDVVTVHTPNIPACRKQVGPAQFAAMQDDTVFINTARGACIDEEALIAELQKGRLFAYLDVSDPEPPAANSPLRSLPNVWYSSHIAGGPSVNIGHQAVDDVAAFIKGGSPMCVVTADQLETTG